MTEAKRDELARLLTRKLSDGMDPREQRHRAGGSIEEIVADALPILETLRPGEIRVQIDEPGGSREGRTTLRVLIADSPFLVDTVRLTLKRSGVKELLFLHPLLPITRDEDGSILAVGDDVESRESFMYAELPLIEDEHWRSELCVELERVLGQVKHVVADHGAMVRELRELASRLEPNAASFLEWLADDGFVFLGYRRYSVEGTGSDWRVSVEPERGLGVLRDAAGSRFASALEGQEVPTAIRIRLDSPRQLFLDKSRTESTIHRQGRLDSVSVKVLDAHGRAVGYARFVGLLTFKAIQTRPSSIALLAERRERVLGSIGAERGSHDYKACLEAFDSLPIEFLIPYAIGDVTEAVRRIVSASSRRQIEVCVVPDPLNRSFFLSVIVPRPLYDEALRRDIDAMLVRD